MLALALAQTSPPSRITRAAGAAWNPFVSSSVSRNLGVTAGQHGAALFIRRHFNERSSPMLSCVRFSIVLLCLLAIGSLTSGCATMANTDQQISVYTIPHGADVVIGEIKGVSPMAATVPGGYAIPQSIQVSKEGYQSQTVTVQRGFRVSSLVTDLFPGLFLAAIPLMVDLATGDFHYVANTSYTIRLVPVATGANTTTSPAAQAVGQIGLGKYDLR
jgi:hypothetical protein